MKYLYKFIRLFICPHKYSYVDRIKEVKAMYTTEKVLCQCVRCGKIKVYRI